MPVPDQQKYQAITKDPVSFEIKDICDYISQLVLFGNVSFLMVVK